MKKKMLTPLELKVMNILWDIESGFVKDILDNWKEGDVNSKKHYNTISTIVRILRDKGFLDVKAYGRTHQYFPIISREDYQGTFLKNALANVFKGKISSLVSTLVDDDSISDVEMEELKSLIDKKKID